MKQVRAIQIIDSLNLGGAETLAVNIANALQEENHPSFLCTTRLEGDLKESMHKNVEYIFLERKSKLDFKAIIKLYKYIRKHQINVIHAHSTSILIATVVKFFLGKKVKLIWHAHSGAYIHLKGIKLIVFKLCSYIMSAIIVVNKNLLEWSKKLHAKETELLHNFPSFVNKSKKTILKGKEGKRIICVAGLRKEKDHLMLLKSFSLINKEAKDWTLHIVGKDYQDSYSKSLYEFVEANNLGTSTFFYGAVTDIENVLSQADIGVLSSESEGFPISIVEYGLMKLPILVTDVGELREIVMDKRGISEAKNVMEYTQKLECLIQDKVVRDEISSKFHERVISEYSKESFLKKLLQIYKEEC